MLSVHGKRSDGFHELTSLMAPLHFGDELALREIETGPDILECTDERLPTDASNLVLRAAAAFRRASGVSTNFTFRLKKRIPVGAGLGGGSSNASSALLALNEWFEEPLSPDSLTDLAAELGSDCPFFLSRRPALIGGRGERIERLPRSVLSRLEGQRILLCDPPFPVETAWAYRRLANSVENYEAAANARQRLDGFFAGGEISDLLFNSFEGPVGEKYLAIPTFLEILRAEGASCLMSGSGGACFILLPAGTNGAALIDRCHSCWGKDAFCVETFIIGQKDAGN